MYTIPEVTEQKGNAIKTQILGRWKQYFELIIQFYSYLIRFRKDIFNNYSTSARWTDMRWQRANEERSTEMAIIIPYPTSASGITVLSQTPTKFRELFPTLFAKNNRFSARF